jgi:threonine aldolase
MRQSGVIAAAALVGLETLRDRLGEDHALARALAEGLANTAGIAIDAAKVQTNIVAFQLAPGRSGEKFRDGCLSRGLKLSCYGGDWSRLRAVTHHDVGPEEVSAALAVVAAAVKEA